ncbi:MAG: serine hydrolase domain-containing protein, partial [Janthinobacterium lividum]
MRRALFLPAASIAVVVTAVSLLSSPARAATRPVLTTAAAAVDAQLRADHVPTAAFALVQTGGRQDVEVRTGTRGAGVTDTTPFVLGSISKSFTALAVLQLVDADRVDLDAPVARYLPDFHTAQPGAVVTVGQLLTQTSGLPTSAGVAIIDHPETSLVDRVRAVATVRPVSPPGRTFHYSNLNYAVLGRVVEQVSGISFARYVQQRIFDPLGMTGSSTSLAQARHDGLPSASTVWFGLTVSRSTPDYPGGAPDGFLVSTARDMSHYLS